MLLGHGAIGQLAVAEDLSGLVQNAGTVELTLGQSVATSTGSETVTGSASFAVTTAGAPSFSLGTENICMSKIFRFYINPLILPQPPVLLIILDEAR